MAVFFALGFIWDSKSSLFMIDLRLRLTFDEGAIDLVSNFLPIWSSISTTKSTLSPTVSGYWEKKLF